MPRDRAGGIASVASSFVLLIQDLPATMASLLVPVLYIVLVVGSLLLFSSFYRKRIAGTPFLRLIICLEF